MTFRIDENFPFRLRLDKGSGKTPESPCDGQHARRFSESRPTRVSPSPPLERLFGEPLTESYWQVVGLVSAFCGANRRAIDAAVGEKFSMWHVRKKKVRMGKPWAKLPREASPGRPGLRSKAFGWDLLRQVEVTAILITRGSGREGRRTADGE